jgi:hypothetical protein
MMVLFLLYVLKYLIGISSDSQLPQPSISIPASGFSLVPLVTDYSGIAQLCKTGQAKIMKVTAKDT